MATVLSLIPTIATMARRRAAVAAQAFRSHSEPVRPGVASLGLRAARYSAERGHGRNGSPVLIARPEYRRGHDHASTRAAARSDCRGQPWAVFDHGSVGSRRANR